MSRPIRTIVVGAATTHETDPVLVPAIKLAARLGATLHVVHAFDLPEPMIAAYSRMGYLRPGIASQYGEELCARLEAQVNAVQGRGATRCQARSGTPSAVLSEFAAEVEADLLLVGATRQRSVGRYFLGSTADAVVRTATMPVLVVREATDRPFERVLLTTDLSRFSAAVHERGLDTVQALPGGEEAELRSLLVLAYDPAVPPPLSRDSLDAFMREQMLRFLQERTPRSRRVDAKIRIGDPAWEVMEEARDWGADLVVVGTHGRAGISRLMLGSVASAILRDAPCKVLVVPAALVGEEALEAEDKSVPLEIA